MRRNLTQLPGLVESQLALRIRNTTRGTILAEKAEAADTSQKRRTGLLKHDSLPEGEGLWIVPCEGVHTFGMKFAIDVIYLSKKRVVVGTRPNMVRRRVSVCLRAHSVLEVPAGIIEKTRTQAGDQLEFERL